MEIEMNRHFSYLFDDVSAGYFQKIACQEAESLHGVRARTPEPKPLEKTAAPMSDFEKIASRLDRDIGIIKSAGAIGTSFGMCKRAEFYIETSLNNANLSADEFSEFFDKVAASAIETDLNASWSELSSECPEDMLPWLEWEMSKVGFDMASQATLEKQAIVAAIGRGLTGLIRGTSQARAGGAALKAVAGEGARQAAGGVAQAGRWAAGLPGRTVTRIKGVKGALGARGASRRMGELKADIASIRGKGVAQTAARKNLAQQYKAQVERRAGGLQASQAAGAKLPEGGIPIRKADQAFLAKDQRRQAALSRPKGGKAPEPPPPGKPPGTTAEGTTTSTTKEVSAAKARQSEMGAEKAREEAASAASGGGAKPTPPPVAGGPKPPPTPKTAPPESPPQPAPPPEIAAKPGIRDSWNKWQKDGWSSLGPAEKRSLYQGGAMAAIGYRTVTGKGAITGGEGLI